MSRDYTQIQKLKQEVLSGTTIYADAERRLLEAIRAEEDKADADLDYINTCEDLLLELRTGGEWPSFPTAEKYVAEMQKHMQVKKKNSGLPKFAWRCAAVLAAMFVVVLLGDRLFHWQWFSGISTKDEQQYVIRGHEITIPMIAKSIAEHNEHGELLTDDWDEVTSFLGIVPSVPKADSFGFDSVQYFAAIDPISISLYAQYNKVGSNEADLIYSVHCFTEVDNAYIMLEQNADGIVADIADREVYIAKNAERNTFTWFENTTVYRLAGDFSCEIGTQMLKCIVEDNEE